MVMLSPVVSVVEGKNYERLRYLSFLKGAQILVSVVDFPMVKAEVLSLTALG